jgi:hypothetical protein
MIWDPDHPWTPSLLVMTLSLVGCTRSPLDVCAALLNVEPPALMELEIGRPLPLSLTPAECVAADLSWTASAPGVAQVVLTGPRAATLGPIAAGSGVLSVRDAASGLALLEDVPYRVLAPDLPPLPRDTTALLQTDRTTYLMAAGPDAWQTEVHVTYVNRFATPVVLLPCLGLRFAELQKRVGGEWTRAYVWVYPPLPCFETGQWVEPGGTADVTLEIRAGYPWGPVGFPYTFLTSGVAGTYRLVWGPGVLRTEEEHAAGVHGQERLSNPFQLSVAPATSPPK